MTTNVQGAMLQTFYKLNLKPKTILELKEVGADFWNIVRMHVLWLVVNILNIRYKLFRKIFYCTLLAVL